MSAQFTHLHFHTQYSLLDGANKIKSLPKILQSMDYKACAITDHGNMHGVIEFHHTLKKAGIKPIIGMEAYVAEGSRTKRDYNKPGNNSYHTILLCLNKIGYRNLTKLASLGFLEGKFYGKPRIDHALLEQYNEGLIVLSACIGGEIAKRLLRGEKEEAYRVAQWYKNAFPQRYYIELQANKLKDQDKVNPLLIDLASELDIPLVGTNDCHYNKKEDAYPHHILQLMGWQKRIDDPDIKKMETEELYIKNEEEIKDAFKDLPSECLTNAAIIAENCELDLTNKAIYLPDYKIETNQTPEDYLVDLAQTGLENRWKYLIRLYRWDETTSNQQREIYEKRLRFELEIINKMGFPGYFLIVSEFINWAKENNIPVGPGRGSGAGSLVAYVLKITDIDPIRYDLLFERFLNPDRVSMPDFDIDFDVNGREQVIEHVRQKYGIENVCQISAIGSLQAKGAIRGVARVMNIPYEEADRISKLIPNTLGINLEDAIKQESLLKKMESDGTETEKSLLKVAKALEGLNSNLSTHAAGVIIMDTPITDVMPVCVPTKGDTLQSMFTMKYVEDQGAVKFDFLGLRNLTIIQKALELLNANRPEEEQIDIGLIPLDDPITFRLLTKGETTGVFQLESSGMKALIQKLKPDCFEDIIALVALYRPGPLGSGMVDDYVERKHGRQQIEYMHPLMEQVLNETNGVMVYQEQVMRTVQLLAGFTLGQADMLRRAIGKKIPEILAEQRQRFVDGCAKNKIDKLLANAIFDLIDKFAGYGFNKSHSAAYGLVSYQTAWLKANHPIEFMAALLTSEMNDSDQIVKLINECKEMGIKVLPPDINESEMEFTVHEKRIRFGLNAIKNVGTAALESILKARKACGGFQTLVDVFIHVDTAKVNSRVFEALIKAGVFDSLEHNRRKNLEGLESSLALAFANRNLQNEEQVSMFDMLSMDEVEKCCPKLELPDIDDWKPKERLKHEKAALSFYISGHPLDPFRKEMNKLGSLARISDLKEENRKYKNGDSVTIAAVIVTNITKTTKKNEKFAILQIEDIWGTIEVLVFPRLWKNVENILTTDDPVLITGKVDIQEESVKLIAKTVSTFQDYREQNSNCLIVDIGPDTEKAQMEKIEMLFGKYPGECKIKLNLTTRNHCRVQLSLGQKINPGEFFIENLDDLLPPGNYFFQYRNTDTALVD